MIGWCMEGFGIEEGVAKDTENVISVLLALCAPLVPEELRPAFREVQFLENDKIRDWKQIRIHMSHFHSAVVSYENRQRVTEIDESLESQGRFDGYSLGEGLQNRKVLVSNSIASKDRPCSLQAVNMKR